MRGNAAHNLILEDQIGENMEARISRIESDVAHIQASLATVQLDVRELRDDLKAANESIGEVKSSVKSLEAKVDGNFIALKSEIHASSSALETKLIKWIIGTMIATMSTVIGCTGVALAIAKVVFGSKAP